MKRFTTSTPVVLLTVCVLALSGCGEDPAPTAPTAAEPTAEPTLMDLNGSDASESPAVESETQEADGASVTTEADAQAVVDALDASDAQVVETDRVWIGGRQGEKAVQALGVTLTEGNRIEMAASVDELRFVCVEAGEGVAYTFGTVTAETESFRSGDGGCPEAEVEAVRFASDLFTAAAESESDAKAEKKAARKAAKVEEEAAAKAEKKAERRKEQEAAKAAEEAAAAEDLAAEALVTSVSSDARVVAALLALSLTNQPADPKRPDLTARASELLTTYGITLAGENRLATAKVVRDGFIACVEASATGPSATYSSTTGQLLSSEGSCT